MLIQIRLLGSFAAKHEQRCIADKLGCSDFRTENVFAESPKASWLDGASHLIIGGSGSISVHDDLEWLSPLRSVIETALRRELACFFICFGHQLFAQTLGAKVQTDTARRLVGTVLLTPEARDPLLSAFWSRQDPRFFAHAGHSDHVLSPPAGTTLLASHPRSKVQMLRLKGSEVVSTQFHPDLLAEEARARYFAAFGETAKTQQEVEHFQSKHDSDTRGMLQHWLRASGYPDAKAVSR